MAKRLLSSSSYRPIQDTVLYIKHFWVDNKHLKPVWLTIRN